MENSSHVQIGTEWDFDNIVFAHRGILNDAKRQYLAFLDSDATPKLTNWSAKHQRKNRS